MDNNTQETRATCQGELRTQITQITNITRVPLQRQPAPAHPGHGVRPPRELHARASGKWFSQPNFNALHKSTSQVLSPSQSVFKALNIAVCEEWVDIDIWMSVDKLLFVLSGSQIETSNKTVKSIVTDFTGHFNCIIISFVRVLRIRKIYNVMR